jgi:tetratricopeptide (TPR) repeat protein
MDILAIIGIIAAVVSIIAGVVQVLDYRQKRREKPARVQEPPSYEAGLRCLLNQLGKGHPRYLEALTYQQRLTENTAEALQHGETDTLKAERSQIIEQLNVLALSALGIPFNELCSQAESPKHGSSPIPHNLPPRSEFVGRQAEKARVHKALRSRSRLVSIDGIGGIGKTALALEVAHECLAASQGERAADDVATFHGFIWTTAKDYDLTLNALLDTIARVLQHTNIAQQPLEEKQFSVYQLLQEKPYLLVVDNFETITDRGVQSFLMQLPEPSKALITSREQLPLETNATSLKSLTESEALALIRGEGKRLGLASVEQGTDEVLLPLYQITGGAPLAIKWAVGQIKQRGQSLDGVLKSLHRAEADVFVLIFARSWSLLSVDARQVLMVMPLFATSASRASIKAVSNVPDSVFEKALGQLVEMSLVDVMDDQELTRRRYSIHPLTRAYAERRSLDGPKSKREAAYRRMIRHFCSYAQQQSQDMGDNFDCLEVDLNNILAAFDYGNEREEWDQVINLLEAISDFLDRRGYWDERVRLSERAMSAARKSGKYEAQGRIAIYHRGWTLLLQEKYAEARQLAEEGLEIARERNYPLQVALALRNLGVIELEEKHYDRARELCESSLEWWAEPIQPETKLDPRRGKAKTLGTLGNIARELRQYSQANEWYLRQQAVYHELDDPYGLSVTYTNLAICAVYLGRPLQAVHFCRKALEEFRRTGRADGPGYMMMWFGKTRREGSYPGRRQMLLDNSVSFVKYGRKPVLVYSYYLLRAVLRRLTGEL